jgi:hypothetical protein
LPGDFDDPINRSRRDLERVSTFLSSIVENIPAMIFVKNAETLRFERSTRPERSCSASPARP